MKRYTFVNGKIVTPFDILHGFALEVHGHKIVDIYRSESHGITPESEVIDAHGRYLVPGFIDIHNHGAMGVDFAALQSDIDPATRFFAENGVTSFLLTNGSPPMEKIFDCIATVEKTLERGYTGARILGLNLEGPFLNPQHGAQRNNTLKPERAIYEPIVERALPLMKIMTVPPELEGAPDLITHLRERGVVVGIGHSEATREQVDDAILRGAGLATHLFDAFGPPVYKMKGVKPVGIEEYLLTREDIVAEILPDKNGIHVEPVLLKMAFTVKGKEGLIIITDSTFPAGVESTEQPDSDGRTFEIRDDLRFNTINGDLSGSVMTLNQGVRNLMRHADVSLKDAVYMASYNPARLLRVDTKKGSLKMGMDADIVIIDEDINVYFTMVEGNVIVNKLSK